MPGRQMDKIRAILESTRDYVGVNENGIVVALMVDDGQPETFRELARWAKKGYAVHTCSREHACNLMMKPWQAEA